MSQAAQKHARNLVVMITAGGAMDEVLEMARAFGVRAVHVQQLAVPDEERKAQQILVRALQRAVTATRIRVTTYPDGTHAVTQKTILAIPDEVR